ncbi:MAG: hypothetical protein ACTS73_01350 [Arsenophonus sp. NEOnobi-MAG3]
MPPWVRNSYLVEQTIQSGISNVEIKVSKVRDLSINGIWFNSSFLPNYLKRLKTSNSGHHGSVPTRHLHL